MPNYTKLFNSIVTSTIWTEDDKTRILWITMLAMADQNGEVHASIPGLARIAGIDVGATEKALNAFMGPDHYSRTPDNEGRRIAPIAGGWELLNHAKYRKMASKEDSKAATAERVRRFRERGNGVTPCNAPVTPCNAAVTVGRDIAEAEAEAEADTIPNDTPLTPQGGDVADLAAIIWNHSPKMGRERSSKANVEAAIRKIPAKDRPTPEHVADALMKWNQSESWTKDGGAFVPGIHRWAKGRQWENIPEPASSRTPSHRTNGYNEHPELPD